MEIIIPKELYIETNNYLKGIAKQYSCNIALTIQPNSKVNTITGLQERMGMVEDIINKYFFLRKPFRNKFFYIATIEYNHDSGYHLHLAISVPERIKDWFIRKIESIVKHQNNFPRSSVEVKAIYYLDGWMDYITKDMYLSECSDNYFFNNQYNKYKKTITH